jgi:hypothetical protein
MMNTNKTIGHYAMWAQALLLHGAAKGARDLGDRQTYLGLSDIGRGIECLRAAVCNKLNHSFAVRQDELRQFSAVGDVNKIMNVLRKEITKQRGHWVEAGMAQALSSLKVNYFTQLEIKTLHRGIPIQAHLDLTLIGSRSPSVRVLELKSTKRLRDRLFAAHETQLYAQLGFLKALWNAPAFNLKNAEGVLVHHDLTFPELAKKVFGISMPKDVHSVDIEGWVVSVVPDNAKVYGPYAPHDDTLKVCLQIAEQIWSAVSGIRSGAMSMEDVPHNKGFHPLCDWCDYNATCPKYQGRALEEYSDILEQRSSIKERISAMEDDCRELDEELKAAYRRLVATGQVKQGEWVIAGNMRFRVLITSEGSERLYTGSVNEEPALPANHIPNIASHPEHGLAA